MLLTSGQPHSLLTPFSLMPLDIILNTLYKSKRNIVRHKAVFSRIAAHYTRMKLEKRDVEIAIPK
jgi:hypothetical protein